MDLKTNWNKILFIFCIIMFAILIIVDTLCLVTLSLQIKGFSVDQWFTLLGTPFSLILGVGSIAMANSAKQSAIEAKIAVTNKYKNHELEQLYANILQNTNEVSSELVTLIGPGKEESKGNLIKICETITKIVSFYDNKNEINDDKELRPIFKNLNTALQKFDNYSISEDYTVKKDSEEKNILKNIYTNISEISRKIEKKQEALLNE